MRQPRLWTTRGITRKIPRPARASRWGAVRCRGLRDFARRRQGTRFLNTSFPDGLNHIQPGGVLAKHVRTDLEVARDELMSHIHRCGVLKASREQQSEWLEDTMDFMAERYPSLSEDDLGELQQIGQRFCQPVISRTSDAGPSEAETDSEGEMVGAA